MSPDSANSFSNFMSESFPAAPLFDAHRAFSRLPAGLAALDDYPDTAAFLENTLQRLPDAREDYAQSQAFLRSYSRKSEATYRSYRNEVERLLLWAWTVRQKSVVQLKRPDLEAFFDFLHSPPSAWISPAVVDRFVPEAGLLRQNPAWRPFSHKGANPTKQHRHTLSQEAMKMAYSALSAYYDYLTHEGYAFGNPIPAIRKQSPYLLKGTTRAQLKRLSDLQWEFVLQTSQQAADEDEKHERTLFVIACLKTLYLRISELSERTNWQPAWAHFWRDDEGNYWLNVLGKGNKLRDVSVPSALLPYIERYRRYRQSQDAYFDTHSALVAKIRGQGGMSARQLRRIVQEAFDMAVEAMNREGFSEEAKTLKEATTHWLRHTGASQDIAFRPLKHMADDLGHSSMGTTDRVYIQSDMKERASSGKKREV